MMTVMGRVARPGGNKLDPEDWKRGRMGMSEALRGTQDDDGGIKQSPPKAAWGCS